MNQLAYHDSLLSLLGSLATLGEQGGDGELICQWFDDLYFPAHTCPENCSKEVWERGQREWCACFSDSELVVLAHFNQVFSAEVANLTDQLADHRRVLGWRRVSKAAAMALDELNSLPQQGAAVSNLKCNRCPP